MWLGGAAIGVQLQHLRHRVEFVGYVTEMSYCLWTSSTGGAIVKKVQYLGWLCIPQWGGTVSLSTGHLKGTIFGVAVYPPMGRYRFIIHWSSLKPGMQVVHSHILRQSKPASRLGKGLHLQGHDELAVEAANSRIGRAARRALAAPGHALVRVGGAATRFAAAPVHAACLLLLSTHSQRHHAAPSSSVEVCSCRPGIMNIACVESCCVRWMANMKH
jgi:hypothetical protein